MFGGACSRPPWPDVGGIILSPYLEETQRVVSNTLLDPEALRVYVPQLPQALTLADPDSGRAIGPCLYGKRYSYIFQE